MGQLHAQTIATHDGSRLVGVCDVNMEHAAAVGRQLQAEAFEHIGSLLEKTNPNIVVVATPDHLHHDITIAAMQAGCHIFCEKPLSETVAEAEQMVEAAQRCGVWLAVNYNRRYGFAYQEARKRLEAGELGEILSVTIDVVDGVPPASVARSADVMLTTLLTHHFDLVRFLAGEVTRVTARFAPEVDGLHRNVTVLLELASSAQAVVVGSYRRAQRETRELAHVVGSLGSLMLKDVMGPLEISDPDSAAAATLNPHSCSASDALTVTSQYHLRDFLTRISRGEVPAICGRDGLRGLQIADAARISFKENRTVPLPQRANHD